MANYKHSDTMKLGIITMYVDNSKLNTYEAFGVMLQVLARYYGILILLIKI